MVRRSRMRTRLGCSPRGARPPRSNRQCSPHFHPLEPRLLFAAWIDTSNRAVVANFYNTEYLASAGVPDGWTGNYATGNPGATGSAFQTAVLRRVNYFRSMAGVGPIISLDASEDAMDQAAALMMSANNALSHSPPPTWTFYTSDGAAAAASSDLSLGTYGPDAVDGYIADPGANNASVGHRRWLLYPQTQTIGTGDVPADPLHLAANALWVFDSNMGGPRPATRTPYVAWPAPGFMPYEFSTPRWSFSYANADFSNASVTMTRDGAAVPVTLDPVANGYGENTLVWDYIGKTVPDDTDFAVSINNVIINGAPQNFSYTVTSFNPSPNATATTATQIVSATNPTALGQTAAFTAIVSSAYGKPTGNVTFYDGAITQIGTVSLDSTGTAAVSTAALSAGAHVITALYNGSSAFTWSSAILIQIVSDGVDTAPPNPNPSTFAVAPLANGATSITMTAATATDPSGVQYYFHNLTLAGHDSGWQTNTTFTDYNLAPGSWYSYQVKARDQSPAQNTGDYSAIANAATPAPPSPAPAAPSALSATAISSRAVAISWKLNGANATTVNVARWNGAAWAVIAQLAGNATSYTDTNLAAHTLYYYEVQASNAAGSAWSPNDTSVTTLSTLPAAPTGLAAAALSASAIQLTWQLHGGETRVILMRWNGTVWVDLATLAAGTTGYTDTALAPNTRYYYDISAANSAGTTWAADYASVVTLPWQAPPLAPSNLTASATPGASPHVQVSWTLNGGAETVVYVAKWNGVTWQVIAALAAGSTAYLDTASSRGSNYYEVITANPFGSTWSGVYATAFVA